MAQHLPKSRAQPKPSPTAGAPFPEDKSKPAPALLPLTGECPQDRSRLTRHKASCRPGRNVRIASTLPGVLRKMPKPAIRLTAPLLPRRLGPRHPQTGAPPRSRP